MVLEVFKPGTPCKIKNTTIDCLIQQIIIAANDSVYYKVCYFVGDARTEIVVEACELEENENEKLKVRKMGFVS